PLLEPLDLEGRVVTADAMHTQVEHARFIVEDKKADYVFPVKQNQGNLFETIKSTRNEDFGNINLQIDNTKAKVGVQQVTLDVSPKIIDDRTYIPLRFIAESIGAKVNWNGEKHSVEIIYLATMSIQKKYSMITNGLSLSKTDLQELSCIENYILTNEAIEIWNALDDEAKNTFKSNIITEMRIKIPNLLTYELNFFDSDNTEIDQYKWEDANIKAEIEKKAKEDSLNYPSIKRK
ncbi:copper amine oxidase N-terminal domain-containing protein, partial [Pelotomaculum propionicicum]|uniref:copper amine oxidase N-terminal domain-containing protein n=1 Tax=Pelotomaculum propionicicum TaxID=258475 RepID=UPI001864CFAD